MHDVVAAPDCGVTPARNRRHDAAAPQPDTVGDNDATFFARRIEWMRMQNHLRFVHYAMPDARIRTLRQLLTDAAIQRFARRRRRETRRGGRARVPARRDRRTKLEAVAIEMPV